MKQYPALPAGILQHGVKLRRPRGSAIVSLAVGFLVFLPQAGKALVQPLIKPLPLVGAQRHTDLRIDEPCAAIRRAGDDATQVALVVLDEGQHRHQQHAGENAAAFAQLFDGVKSHRGRRSVRLHQARELVLCRRDGDLRKRRVKARNFGKQICIPHNQIGFRGNRHAIAVTQQQFQRAARQALVLFKGIIGIAHRAHAHHALAGMAAQLTFQQLQRILFAPHTVEFMHLITGGAAVAINTAVAAPPVEIDVPAMTEPAFAGAALHQLPGLHLFHALPPLCSFSLQSRF